MFDGIRSVGNSVGGSPNRSLFYDAIATTALFVCLPDDLNSLPLRLIDKYLKKNSTYSDSIFVNAVAFRIGYLQSVSFHSAKALPYYVLGGICIVIINSNCDIQT